jgi:preprotein translocase subunit SecF
MKKVINFHKGFLPAVLISTAVIFSGIGAFIGFHGFKMGVDFAAGLNETVRIAQPAMELTYSGQGHAQIGLSATAARITISGTTDKSDKVVDFPLAQYKTINDLATALNTVANVQAAVKDGATLESAILIPLQQGENLLGATPFILHRGLAAGESPFADVAKIRAAAETIGSSAVQAVGAKNAQEYMIRIEDNGKDPNFSKVVTGKLFNALTDVYGADKIIVESTNFVGARFSKDLGGQAAWLTVLAILAILVYCLIRFKIQYALGAVLSVLHDGLIMVAFIAWSRIEFNTQSIAAILTILGYSINDTIVNYDRIREDRRLYPDKPYRHVLDLAITETLSRTIITSLVTLLCVITLCVFTTGDMRNFTILLIVGMLAGTYSTIYIAGAFVDWWNESVEKRRQKRIDAIEEKERLSTAKKA